MIASTCNAVSTYHVVLPNFIHNMDAVSLVSIIVHQFENVQLNGQL